jgi:hypothetical protein
VAMRYQPYIYIGGVYVAGGGNGTALVAIDRLTIDWGRSEIYSEPDPATLTLVVLDPTGEWSSSRDMIGQLVEIYRAAPDIRMYRGRVTDLVTRPFTISDTVTGKPRRVWRTEIITADPTAELARMIVPGTGDAAPSNTSDTKYLTAWHMAQTVGPFDPSNAANDTDRVADIMSRGANQIVTAIERPATKRQVARHQYDEGLSLLDLVRKMYHVDVLAHVNYDAATNALTVGRTATSSTFALTFDGLIRFTPTAGLTVDARTVIVSDGLNLTSTVGEGIDTVEVTHARTIAATNTEPWSTEYVKAPAGRTAQYSPASKGARALEIKTDMTSLPAIAALTAATVAAVDGINGKFRVEGLRYDFRRFDSGNAALDALLLDTKDRPTPLYFTGSLLNRFANAGPQFQMIGASLSWEPPPRGSSRSAGWVVDMRLAPTSRIAAPGNLKVGELVTNAARVMGEFDPRINLSDLGNVTIGLS